ncbi:sensor histidine kinase [Paenibacillus sp. OV219]|uniref:sensor histidine kinase n=1 Tax=Paenibacillus sp. OV219 TaxID=1884377 RepID=UPI0008C995A0|nr:sensor histidine kinase [Paenibacillus sp. OV219]SEO36280.1 two-component system, sensor histidine kinase YesM [Paenibacillus sp. OV219]
MSRGFHSIQYRLFVLFLISMSAIVLIVSILYYNRTTVQFQEKVSGLSKQNVSQTAGLFDLLLKGYDSMSKSVIGNNDFSRIMSTPTVDSPAVDYFNERAITNILGAVFLSQEDLIGIHVLTDKGKVYNYGNFANVIDPEYTKSHWYQEIQGSSGSMVWLGVYKRSIIDQVESRSVFAFGRRIYDLNNHRQVGVVLFETSSQAIVNAMENLKLGVHSEVYLMSSNGEVISSTSQTWDDQRMSTLPRPKGGVPVVVENDGNLIVASQLPFADWTVLSVTPERDLNVELAETKRFLIYVGAALVLVAILIATIFSRTISSPLKRLISEMKQVEIGNFRGSLKVTSYQEINILVASFNQMVNQISELIERVKISSVSEKNAELQALQSQVNPHFLYNTLDMIYWMLDEKGHDRLGEVVLSLSRLFRYSSHWDQGVAVSLREEIEQTQHYLTIIVTRLEGRLTVDVDVDETWMNVPLPKMTLQPVIENAVKYGLEPLLDWEGKLRVYIEADDRKLHIMVQDNGIGMDAAKLKRINTLLDKPEEAAKDEEGLEGIRQEGGIGLVNLQRRIRHMYGEAYGLELRSEPNEGTTVIITVPYQ